MSDPDGTTESLIVRALDPAHSVVVEACAGSGKTWLLASRIVRLLLAGVAPGEILAITFTRKAAREIEERVVDWLRLLATVGWLSTWITASCRLTPSSCSGLNSRCTVVTSRCILGGLPSSTSMGISTA